MAETSEFRTTLDNFTGPLDLLLYLIRKDEIDILDIPIAQVLEQYEQFVRFLADIDVNLAADYLVMATTLMEIKSRMLLPQTSDAPEEEELEDPRAELVRQLLEYRTYKERALDLAAKLEEQARRYKRMSSDLPFPLDHVELGRLSLWDVVTAFIRIQKAIAANRPSEVVYTERPLGFYMDAIQGVFAAAGSRTVPFEDVFLRGGPVDRYTLIGTFLAILEFVKLGALALDRDDATGAIVVILRISSLSDCMQNLAVHANIGESLPEAASLENAAPDAAVAPDPALDPETAAALAQLDPEAVEDDEIPLRAEPDEDIVYGFDQARPAEPADGGAEARPEAIVPDEPPGGPAPGTRDAEANACEEPCA